MTFVPVIFQTLIDVDAVCPYQPDGQRYFSFDDAIKKSSGAGEIGWALVQNLPGIGPLMMGFGPFLCFKRGARITDPWKELIVLKENRTKPPYYYDAALSIFNSGAMPILEVGNLTVEGDPRFKDPRLFHYGDRADDPRDVNGAKGYPIWVDFAHPTMLNKMAQFYLDSSRKMLRATSDGYTTYEYISRFYGLISTTELTCDVQCEITQVKFDAASGLKICEGIVEMSPEATSVYHDRRFYFYKDLKL